MKQRAIHELAERIEAMTTAERSQAIKTHARITGVTPKTVYRKLKAINGGIRKTPRSDAGKRKKALPAGVLDKALAMQAQGQFDPPAQAVVEELEATGAVKRGLLSKHDIHRERRRRKLGRKDAKRQTPFREMKSLYPNHVHQFDPSQGKQWYLVLEDDGSIGWESGTVEVYRNKPGSGRPKLWRYLVVDHYSGAFMVQYFYMPGESAVAMIEFLHAAWDRKPDDSAYPFCGMPEILYCDKGPGNKSAMVTNLMTAHGIKYIHHAASDRRKPHEPRSRATGAVEGLHHHWESSFESIAIQRGVGSLAELNRLAMSKSIQLQSDNRRKHSRHGQTRFDGWHAGMIEHERPVQLPPPLGVYLESAGSDPEPRLVRDNYRISFGGRQYTLSPEIFGDDIRGETVLVSWNPWHRPAVTVTYGDIRQMIEPLTVGAGGFTEAAIPFGTFADEKARPDLAKTAGNRNTDELQAAELTADDFATDYTHADTPTYTPIDAAPSPLTVADNEPLLASSTARQLIGQAIRDATGKGATEVERGRYVAMVGNDGITRTRLNEIIDEMTGDRETDHVAEVG